MDVEDLMVNERDDDAHGEESMCYKRLQAEMEGMERLVKNEGVLHMKVSSLFEKERLDISKPDRERQVKVAFRVRLPYPVQVTSDEPLRQAAKHNFDLLVEVVGSDAAEAYKEGGSYRQPANVATPYRSNALRAPLQVFELMLLDPNIPHTDISSMKELLREELERLATMGHVRRVVFKPVPFDTRFKVIQTGERLRCGEAEMVALVTAFAYSEGASPSIGAVWAKPESRAVVTSLQRYSNLGATPSQMKQKAISVAKPKPVMLEVSKEIYSKVPGFYYLIQGAYFSLYNSSMDRKHVNKEAMAAEYIVNQMHGPAFNENFSMDRSDNRGRFVKNSVYSLDDDEFDDWLIEIMEDSNIKLVGESLKTRLITEQPVGPFSLVYLKSLAGLTSCPSISGRIKMVDSDVQYFGYPTQALGPITYTEEGSWSWSQQQSWVITFVTKNKDQIGFESLTLDFSVDYTVISGMSAIHLKTLVVHAPQGAEVGRICKWVAGFFGLGLTGGKPNINNSEGWYRACFGKEEEFTTLKQSIIGVTPSGKVGIVKNILKGVIVSSTSNTPTPTKSLIYKAKRGIVRNDRGESIYELTRETWNYKTDMSLEINGHLCQRYSEMRDAVTVALMESVKDVLMFIEHECSPVTHLLKLAVSLAEPNCLSFLKMHNEGNVLEENMNQFIASAKEKDPHFLEKEELQAVLSKAMWSLVKCKKNVKSKRLTTDYIGPVQVNISEGKKWKSMTNTVIYPLKREFEIIHRDVDNCTKVNMPGDWDDTSYRTKFMFKDLDGTCYYVKPLLGKKTCYNIKRDTLVGMNRLAGIGISVPEEVNRVFYGDSEDSGDENEIMILGFD